MKHYHKTGILDITGNEIKEGDRINNLGTIIYSKGEFFLKIDYDSIHFPLMECELQNFKITDD